MTLWSKPGHKGLCSPATFFIRYNFMCRGGIRGKREICTLWACGSVIKCLAGQDLPVSVADFVTEHLLNHLIQTVNKLVNKTDAKNPYTWNAAGELRLVCYSPIWDNQRGPYVNTCEEILNFLTDSKELSHLRVQCKIACAPLHLKYLDSIIERGYEPAGLPHYHLISEGFKSLSERGGLGLEDVIDILQLKFNALTLADGESSPLPAIEGSMLNRAVKSLKSIELNPMKFKLFNKKDQGESSA